MQTKPKIPIDISRVEMLVAQGLTQEQIADVLGITDRTLYRRKYVDVIIRRWQDFTGDVATLEGNGRTFSEIAEERS